MHLLTNFPAYVKAETFSVVPIAFDVLLICISNLGVARQVLAGANRSDVYKPLVLGRAFGYVEHPPGVYF